MNNSDYLKLIKKSHDEKLRLTKKQEKQIKEYYNKIYLNASKKLSKLNNDKLQDKQLLTTLKSISEDILAIQDDLEKSFEENMTEIADTANQVQLDMLLNLDKTYKLGLAAVLVKIFKDIPNKAVDSILRGNIYKDNKSLKKRIKRCLNKLQKDLKYIVKQGVKQAKNNSEIIKDLQTYLKVNSAKSLSWCNSYPKASTQVDYHMQTICRTSFNHSYQESQRESCKRNPFVVGIKWLVSNSHKVCPLCQDRNGVVYKIDEVPLDHPRGMCTTIPVLEKELDQIGEELKSWIEGESNPKLDNWFKKYGSEFM